MIGAALTKNAYSDGAKDSSVNLTKGQNCDLTANKSLQGCGWGRGWQMGEGRGSAPGEERSFQRGH